MSPDEDLVLSLLDSAKPLDEVHRSGLIELLRTHPRLTDDVTRLEASARDSGIEDLHTAAEMRRMFMVLCASADWAHASKILDDRVPYAQLLAVAKVRRDQDRDADECLSRQRVQHVMDPSPSGQPTPGVTSR